MPIVTAGQRLVINNIKAVNDFNKKLSYRRETALHGTLVLAERGRLELAVQFNSRVCS